MSTERDAAEFNEASQTPDIQALAEFWSCVWYYIAAHDRPEEIRCRVWAVLHAANHPLSRSMTISKRAVSCGKSNATMHNRIADAKLTMLRLQRK